MFLPAELGNWLGARIDHPRTGSCDRRNIGRFGPLVKWFEKTAGQLKSGSNGWREPKMWAGHLPWSHTPRSHSMQSASVRGQTQAWVLRHFLLWHTQASQKSHTAPFWKRQQRRRFETFAWFPLKCAQLVSQLRTHKTLFFLLLFIEVVTVWTSGYHHNAWMLLQLHSFNTWLQQMFY